MIVTVSSKGQIVLPVEVRRKYGIDSGTRLVVVDMAGVLSLVPASDDPLNDLHGMLAGTPGVSSEEFLDERRRERDREKAEGRDGG